MRLVAICAIALAFGFVGSMPIAGPVSVMVLSRSARRRFDEALHIGLGAAVAEAIYAGLAFFGYTTFLARDELVVPISHAVTAVVLMALGGVFLFFSPNEKKDTRENKTGTFLLGFSVSAVNPTLLVTWGAATAFLFSRGLGETSALAAVPFGLCAGAGVGAWFALFVVVLRKYEGKLPRKVLTWIVRLLGLALVGLGVWSAVQLVQWWAGGRQDRAGGAPVSAAPVRRVSWAAVDTRRASLSLVVDGAHYTHVTQAVARATPSVWIATANVKQLMVEAPIGTSARARGRYVPILDTFQSLCDRGVRVRLLHASPPSRPFREELAARRERLSAPRFEMRSCPRVHLKMIAIDGALLYLGSANFTGAGLGAKGDGRRNFELGVLTDDDWMLDAAQARFDSIWRGAECASCRLRTGCPNPLDRVQAARVASRRDRGRDPAPAPVTSSPSRRRTRSWRPAGS
jgi:threonine/homoserine/homoserine lactone efflux protein